jgi:uncharacterized membrane protein (UPF0127 family)
MIVYNTTRKTTLTTELKVAQAFSDRFLGLLKKSNSQALLFYTRFGIHTFFLPKPIDVLILDQELRVVKLALNLRPNRVFFWPLKYQIVIELPRGVIEKTRTSLGDKLSLKSTHKTG